MTKIGELDLLPIPGWQAPPTYFISAGGLGYLTLSWLMYFISRYLPQGTGMENFTGARFLAVDTEEGERHELPEQDWARNVLFRLPGNAQAILEEVQGGNYPGIRKFIESTPKFIEITKKVGDLQVGAGVTRPLGRMALHYNWDAFYHRLQELLQERVQSQPMRFAGDFTVEEGNRRHFFITCSLAGGTGSSCFLDIAATLRYLHDQQYPQEEWFIMGVFTLAEVLAVDKSIHQEEHRRRMKANTYAALKELNHYCSGHPFVAQYGRTGETEVSLSNQGQQDNLYDLVLLVDTPNQNHEPLSGKREVASFLAQAMLLLGLTPLQAEFLARLVNDTASLIFEQTYPPGSGWSDGRERQKRLFSSIGLATLSLPVTRYFDWACEKAAGMLFERIHNTARAPNMERLAEDILDRLHLAERNLEEAYADCMRTNMPDVVEALEQIRFAANPMDELRRLAQIAAQPAVSAIRTEARRVTDEMFLNLTNSAARTDIQSELDRLQQQGLFSCTVPLVDILLERLERYRARLERDHGQAISRARAGEVADSANDDYAQAGITGHHNYVELLSAMEEDWNWFSRFMHRWQRDRFLLPFQGELEGVLRLLADAERTALTLQVAPEKMRLVDQLTGYLNGLRRNYEDRSTALQRIRSRLMRRQWQHQNRLQAAYRHQLFALSATDYWDEIFLDLVPDLQGTIAQLAEEVTSQGLTLSPGGGRITMDRWDQHEPEKIAQCLADLVRNRILQGAPCDPDTPLNNAHHLYQVGLDHACFLPTDRVTSFYARTVPDWQRRARPSLLFSGSVAEPRTYLVSGCRIDEPSNNWSDHLHLGGLNPYAGGPPNQASLLSILLAFPVTAIARTKDWFQKAYLPELRNGWPLHLVPTRDVITMMEPHLEWSPLPNRDGAEQLYIEAERSAVLATIEKNGQDCVFIDPSTIDTLPPRIRSFFYQQRPQGASVPEQELVQDLEDHPLWKGLLQRAFVLSARPDSVSEEEWERRRKAVSSSDGGFSTEELIVWAADAGLLEQTNDSCIFSDTIYSRAETEPAFRRKYFPEVSAVVRDITRDEFIDALTRHEALYRWMVKRVVGELMGEARRGETRRRLNQGRFHPFLEDTLRTLLKPAL